MMVRMNPGDRLLPAAPRPQHNTKWRTTALNRHPFVRRVAGTWFRLAGGAHAGKTRTDTIELSSATPNANLRPRCRCTTWIQEFAFRSVVQVPLCGPAVLKRGKIRKQTAVGSKAENHSQFTVHHSELLHGPGSFGWQGLARPGATSSATDRGRRQRGSL